MTLADKILKFNEQVDYSSLEKDLSSLVKKTESKISEAREKDEDKATLRKLGELLAELKRLEKLTANL